MSDDVIPLDEIGKIETVKVYNQAYVDKLEKENAELEEKLANADYQLEGRDNEIRELERENAELKGLKDVATLIRANNDTVITLMQLNNMLVSKSQQLTKAKEIIKNLMVFAEMDDREYEPEYKEAEQFLKECEK